MPQRLLARVTALPLREIPATIVAAVVASGVEVGLRALRLPTLARLAGTPLVTDHGSAPRTADTFPLSPELAQRVRAVRRVMRHWPFGDTCLRSALVSGQRIRRLHPILRIGVAKDAGGVRAHAWLEVEGISLDPTAPHAFAVVHSVERT